MKNYFWYSTEEVIYIHRQPRGLIKRYIDGDKETWEAAVGEAWSLKPGDNLIENKTFDSKLEAKDWVLSRLRNRGYLIEKGDIYG